MRTFIKMNENDRRKMTVSAFLAILLKVLSNPALLAGLIAALQKILHP
jgi:hypothetical protein